MATVLVEQTETESLFNQNLAKLLKELRGERSLREFAALIGATHVSLSLWESGKGEPRLQVLGKISALRGWSLDELKNYLEGGLPKREPSVHRIMADLQLLPLEAVAQVAAVAAELTTRSIAAQKVRSVYNSVDTTGTALSA